MNVTDFERAIAWYREAFGFELIYKLDDWKWCELSTPIEGVHIGLGQTDDETRGGMQPTFTVADIESPGRTSSPSAPGSTTTSTPSRAWSS